MAGMGSPDPRPHPVSTERNRLTSLVAHTLCSFFSNLNNSINKNGFKYLKRRFTADVCDIFEVIDCNVRRTGLRIVTDGWVLASNQ